MELKTIHQGTSLYSLAAINERCGALERRAAKVHGEYHKKTRQADIKYNGLDPEDPGMGPIQTRLHEFGKVEGLVFGPRGSASKAVGELIKKMAKSGAERRWRQMGARSVIEARGIVTNRMRRSFGITACLAAARLKRERLGFALGDGEAASKRRRAQQFSWWNWWAEYSARFGVGGGR